LRVFRRSSPGENVRDQMNTLRPHKLNESPKGIIHCLEYCISCILFFKFQGNSEQTFVQGDVDNNTPPPSSTSSSSSQDSESRAG